MRSTFVIASILSAGLIAGANAAPVGEATQATCRDLDSQVTTALGSTQQSTNQEQAKKEQDSGRQYCSRGFYKIGAEHLSQALKLLGQNT